MKSEWKTQRSQMGTGLSERGDVKDKGRYMGMTVSLWCFIVLYYFLLSLMYLFQGEALTLCLTRDRNNVRHHREEKKHWHKMHFSLFLSLSLSSFAHPFSRCATC